MLKQECRKAPKLLFAKKYELGFQLSVHQGENVLIIDPPILTLGTIEFTSLRYFMWLFLSIIYVTNNDESPTEKLTRNIEALKPFT